MIAAVVTDIEGTTTPIAFVRDVLFPHARAHLAAFVRDRSADPAVRALLDEAKRAAGDPTMDDGAIVAALERWIDEDRKVTPLKTLQGLIWEAGYRDGAFRAPLYPDVAGRLAAWAAAGIVLAVYSSGSVMAQKLLFAHTDRGDLTALFRFWFDTTTGAKTDPAAYRRIAVAVGHPPKRILFLSDSAAELDAAARAGLRTVQLVRAADGTVPCPRHACAAGFDAISLDG